VGEADLDSLAADNDGSADGDPAGDDQGLGQAGWLGGSGAGSAQPWPGFERDGAGQGADDDACGQDVCDRPVQPQGDALPGQWQPGADHVVAQADIAGCVDGPVDLGHVPGCGGQRRRPGGLCSGGGEAGQVAGVEPGRQGLDPVAAEQDVDLAEPRPDPDGAPGHRRPEPDLLPGDPEVA
jgi:hypothetical protein